METDGQRARRRMKELIESDPDRREEARARAEAQDSSWFLDFVVEVVGEEAGTLAGEAAAALADEAQSWFSKAGDLEIPDFEIPDIDL